MIAQGLQPLNSSLTIFDRFYNGLRDNGVNFFKELHEEPWGGKQVTCTDPDGNVLKIVEIILGKNFQVSAKGAKRESEGN